MEGVEEGKLRVGRIGENEGGEDVLKLMEGD